MSPCLGNRAFLKDFFLFSPLCLVNISFFFMKNLHHTGSPLIVANSLKTPPWIHSDCTWSCICRKKIYVRAPARFLLALDVPLRKFLGISSTGMRALLASSMIFWKSFLQNFYKWTPLHHIFLDLSAVSPVGHFDLDMSTMAGLWAPLIHFDSRFILY